MDGSGSKSGDGRSKQQEPPQKNVSQTSCSSAPLPSSSSAGQQQCLGSVPIRPRSLYAVHSYQQQQHQQQQLDDGYQRYSELAKYLELSAAAAAADQWTSSNLSSIPSNLWRQSRTKQQQQQQQHQQQQQQPQGHYYPAADEPSCIYGDHWRDLEAAGEPPILGPLAGAAAAAAAAGHVGGAIATPHGTISLRLHNKIRVDMSVDRAVRVINFKNNIVLSLSGSGSASALLHPNGRVFQYGSRVEILAHDVHGNNKYAKMWYKGVSFTSEQCALVYLVDAAGTRTTTDSFSNMSQDFSVDVFYGESRHGPACIQEAASILSTSQYWLSEEGVDNWIINNVRISQTPDGLVRIARNSNKYQLRTSPSNGTASLTTPFLHCTASLGQTSHLFVRRGERRMHYDGTSFIVRNAGHSAGFDDNNQLKVY